jgi:chromate transport protein ChrA
MKQEKPSPALLILILFCIRILFMRLSSNALNKLFRSVWPSLITLLIQIFRKEKTPKQINLQLAALKVIELIHAL